MRRMTWLAAVIFFILTCGADDILLTIGDEKISVRELNEFYQFLPSDDSVRRAKIIDDFIDQQLAIREAISLGYDEDPVVKTAMETNRRDIVIRGYYQTKVIDKIKIKESEIRKLYNQLINQYHLAQIVVSSDSLARIIEKELKKGTAFESLLVYSIDTISPNGDIGKFSELSIPPEILTMLKKTKQGQVTPPTKLGDFTYFIKIIEHEKSDTPKYDEVKEDIKNSIMRERAMAEGEKFIDNVLKQAKIEYNQEGLDILTKPESTLTESDLNTWVVKKYDTSFVRVRTLIGAVQNQLQGAPALDPKVLIERELIPDLVYDRALKLKAENYPEIKRNLKKTLNSLIYQKYYSDNVREKVQVDSQFVADYFKQNKAQYPDKKLSDVYNQIYIKLRDEQIGQLRANLFGELRKKYVPKINQRVLAKVLKGETK